MRRSGSHSISGSVIDASGLAADGAWLNAFPIEEGPGSAHATSKAGAFVLTGLTSGRYILIA
jgi:hypothetical protein